MKAIVCVDKNWGIGKKNDLLFKLKEDMRFFRQTTTGKTVVMGSNTLKSFPDGKPLPKRTNIVLFPGGEKREDCIVCDSLEEIFATLEDYNSDDVFIIGGAMFYHTMLPYCDTVLVTKVEADGNAEVFFDNLDKSGWTLESVSEPVEDNGYIIRFCEYKNNNVLKFGGNNE